MEDDLGKKSSVLQSKINEMQAEVGDKEMFAKYYEMSKSEYNIMLISFDFEEIGLVGSEFFAANIHNYFPDTSKIKGVIVLETLGYYSQEQYLPKGFDILYRKEISKLKQDKIIKGDFLTVIYNGR